jgi:hypothetical protein
LWQSKNPILEKYPVGVKKKRGSQKKTTSSSFKRLVTREGGPKVKEIMRAVAKPGPLNIPPSSFLFHVAAQAAINKDKWDGNVEAKQSVAEQWRSRV